MGVSPVATGVRLVLAASLLAGAVVACQAADPYYRNRPDGGALGLGGTGGFMFHPNTAGSSGDGATTGAGGAAGQGGASATSGTAGAIGAAGSSGAAGTFGSAGATGDAGAIEPCTTCMVKLQYACRSNDTGQASFVLDVTNEASASFPLSSLTLRYWYTVDLTVPQMLDCDYAKLGCTNLVTSADTNPAPKFVNVQPPRMNASKYAEIAFKAGALALDPFLDTGEIQLRLYSKDHVSITQDDDYSYDAAACGDMQGTTVDWPKITAYLDGVLVWGTEPGPTQ
jgi:cellulose binding protein with CBM3 domain